MSKLGARIIKGLEESIAGDLGRVTIEGQTWARVTDIHADQQEIMRINNELREAIWAYLSEFDNPVPDALYRKTLRDRMRTLVGFQPQPTRRS